MGIFIRYVQVFFFWFKKQFFGGGLNACTAGKPVFWGQITWNLVWGGVWGSSSEEVNVPGNATSGKTGCTSIIPRDCSLCRCVLNLIFCLSRFKHLPQHPRLWGQALLSSNCSSFTFRSTRSVNDLYARCLLCMICMRVS